MATTLDLQRAIYSSGPQEIRIMPEAASQSFLMGQFVSLNSNSQVQVASSDDVSVLGMAQGDATGVTDADCEVLLANEGTTFEITVSGTSDPTFAVTDLGVKLAMLVADNKTYADVDDTTNEIFVLVGIKQAGDEGINIVGDDNVRGYVKVLDNSADALDFSTGFQFGSGGESA